MSTSKLHCMLGILCVSLIPCGMRAQSSKVQTPNLGRSVPAEEIQKINITVSPDGKGLPPGSGSVPTGAKVYQEHCQVCHGPHGEGKPQEQLTGGLGTLTSKQPVKTPNSYWPTATTLFDYIRRAMPLNAPESLTNDEVYSVVAYLLSVDKIVPADAELDAKSLPRVKMPNRDGFVSWWPVPATASAKPKPSN